MSEIGITAPHQTLLDLFWGVLSSVKKVFVVV